MKYSLSSEISSSQCSQQPAIVSCSEPQKSSPIPLTLLTEDYSGALANQSLKATTSLVMFIRSSLGLSAVNKAIRTERTYLKIIFGKCPQICRHITILLKIGKSIGNSRCRPKNSHDISFKLVVMIQRGCVLLQVHSNAHEVIAVFFLSPDPEVT
jgi:hypothetical protein